MNRVMPVFLRQRKAFSAMQSLRALGTYKPISRFARKKQQQPGSDTAPSSSASSFADARMDADVKAYFLAEAEDMLSDISDAIEVILPQNPGYEINRIAPDNLEVRCGDNGGTYVFRVDHEQQCLGVVSPVSGVNKYTLHPDEGLWLGVNDSHDMRGLIIRDFMRHCIGLPSFDSMK